ncbi:chymotrypsin-like elastase family member 2A [Limulus polyphemus]|uniref:Chymotrypsin-like elastase family member 2A n=1 Tax=Limulus polyphemus TaxID=6850 RepID=A0ABM1BIP5_LIMPO|nr:chymotrypsin-like elastase family member 2A [Limulus polyphemus]
MVSILSLLSFLLVVIPQTLGDDEACGPNQPKILQGSTGIIQSPGFSDRKNYPETIQCTYEIQAPPGQRVRLNFHFLDIETSSSCRYDYLAVYNKINETQYREAVFCGNVLPRDIMSLKEIFVIRFVSDPLITASGFNLTWLTTDMSLCYPEEFQCKNRKCVLDEVLCDGTDDCGDGTDEEGCDLPLTPAPPCGQPVFPPIEGADRIIGGQEVRQGSWPWQAELQRGFYSPNGHVCGATILNANWVLTAAHCFLDGLEKHRLRLHLGKHNAYLTDPTEQVRYIDTYIIYPREVNKKITAMSDFDIMHDFALIKLNAPLKFTDYVRPACLPQKDYELTVGSFCYVTGWGVTRGTGGNDVLKQAESEILDEADCSTEFVDFNSTTMICTGTQAGGHGVCHGDSGGPLSCKFGDHWEVLGVASYVTRNNMISGLCGVKNGPSGYARISTHIDWINDIMESFS